MSDWLRIGLVAASVAGLLGGLALLQRRWGLHPEIVRKLMHIGSGLIALALPWLFDAVWPVLLLAVLASAGMLAVKYTKGLSGSVGAVTGSVERNTLGEIFFPLAAGLLFLLSGGDKLLYSIPLLILTFADASAALIGVFYGVRRYTTDDGTKTLEGSLAFFQAALLATLVPILLFSEVGRAETLVIALLMALLSMLLDAIAWWGLDNFLIPILSFVALNIFLETPINHLIVQIGVTLLMLVFVAFWRTRTTLNDAAVLSTVIYGYLCWTLGGPAWMMPPGLLFLTYNRLTPPDVARSQRPYTVPVVLSVGAAGLVWLILAGSTDLPRLYYPFALTYAAQLAMIGVARQVRSEPGRPALSLLFQNSVLSWLIILLPYPFVLAFDAVDPWPGAASLVRQLTAALAAVTAGTALFMATQMGEEGYRDEPSRWAFQTLCAFLASIVGIVAAADWG